MPLLQWCPYVGGVLISVVSLFQGCSYFKGVLISKVSLFQECPYFRGVLISGCPILGVSLFQGCPYFSGVLISKVSLYFLISRISYKKLIHKILIISSTEEIPWKFNINAVDCSSVLRVTCPCCFVCVFCDSFLSLLLLSGSLSYILTLTGRRVLVINFTCDVMHTPTYFLRTAIIGMYACVA